MFLFIINYIYPKIGVVSLISQTSENVGGLVNISKH
jgi:hypothetical protein